MITYKQVATLTETALALNVLRPISTYYPEFEYWYVNQVMPGVLVGSDVMIVAEDKARIVGVGIGRMDNPKLRCIRVDPEYHAQGLGIHLIDKVLHAIDCDKPKCTVAEEMMHSFSRILINRFGFSLSKVDKGLYRRNRLEYIFNGGPRV